jgi:hypothetical protein
MTKKDRTGLLILTLNSNRNCSSSSRVNKLSLNSSSRFKGLGVGRVSSRGMGGSI